MIWLSLSFICACGSTEDQQTHREAEPDEAEPDEPHEAEPAWRSLEPVNLIGRIPLGIRVSSTTPSGQRGPCLVADGLSETAWNSASRDEHAWIRFGLPTTSLITAFEMSAGFAKEELFLANRRVRKVSVHHNTSFVAEFVLDIESMDLQRFDFDTPLEGGGDIEIRVEEFEAGTQSRWAEICVSEMKLWGVAQSMGTASPVCTVGEIGEEQEPQTQAFERLYREALRSLSADYQEQMEALSIAVDMMGACPSAQGIRRRLPQVLRLTPDEEGRLPDTCSEFAREMSAAAEACGFDQAFQDQVTELVLLRDSYDPE